MPVSAPSISPVPQPPNTPASQPQAAPQPASTPHPASAPQPASPPETTVAQADLLRLVHGLEHVVVRGDGNCGIEAVLVGRLSQQRHRPSATTSGEYVAELRREVKAARHLMANTLRARMDPENASVPATEKHMSLFGTEAAQLGLLPGEYATALHEDGFYIDAYGVQELAIELNTNIVVLSYLGNSRWTHSVFITSGEYPAADLSLADMVAHPEHYVFLVRTNSHQDVTGLTGHYDLLIPGAQYNAVLHTTSAQVRPACSVLQSIGNQLDEEVIPQSLQYAVTLL